jgi:TRAP-type mannitol/chloroaromatic compound transport system permease small subunit
MAERYRLRQTARALAPALDRATGLGAWLVLPLVLLLFAQWPLRDLVGAWSRQANDTAQWLFALYVALAIRAATHGRAHMAAGLFVGRYPVRWQRRLTRCGEALAVLPWTAFVLFAAAAPAWHSLLAREAFPDTGNPLYFLIRISVLLLALLMALQALVDLVAPATATETPVDESARTT